MSALNARQLSALRWMLTTDGGDEETPVGPTFASLRRRGLAHFVRANEGFGRSRWVLTPAGRAALAEAQS